MDRIERLLWEQITTDLKSGLTPGESLARVRALLQWLAEGPLSVEEEVQVKNLLAQRGRP